MGAGDREIWPNLPNLGRPLHQWEVQYIWMDGWMYGWVDEWMDEWQGAHQIMSSLTYPRFWKRTAMLPICVGVSGTLGT